MKSYQIKSNGKFGICKDPHHHLQHQNQQNGLDLYVTIIDFATGQENHVKLYENSRGLHFKKNGPQYLDTFTSTVTYIPFQIIKK